MCRRLPGVIVINPSQAQQSTLVHVSSWTYPEVFSGLGNVGLPAFQAVLSNLAYWFELYEHINARADCFVLILLCFVMPS